MIWIYDVVNLLLFINSKDMYLVIVVFVITICTLIQLTWNKRKVMKGKYGMFVNGDREGEREWIKKDK